MNFTFSKGLLQTLRRGWGLWILTIAAGLFTPAAVVSAPPSNISWASSASPETPYSVEVGSGGVLQMVSANSDIQHLPRTLTGINAGQRDERKQFKNVIANIRELLQESLHLTAGGPVEEPVAFEVARKDLLIARREVEAAFKKEESILTGIGGEIVARHTLMEKEFDLAAHNVDSALLAVIAKDVNGLTKLSESLSLFQKPVLLLPKNTAFPLKTIENRKTPQRGTAFVRDESSLGVSATLSPNAEDLSESVEVIISPEIRELANALGNSPVNIYEFVRNHVAFQPYMGVRKGSAETLRQRAGNSADQAALLLAMLRASNIPCHYVLGSVGIPQTMAIQWMGTKSIDEAENLLTASFSSVSPFLVGGKIEYGVYETWVEAYVPYSNYRSSGTNLTGGLWVPLDPSFKETTVTGVTNIFPEMRFDVQNFISDYMSTFRTDSPVEHFEKLRDRYLATKYPTIPSTNFDRVSQIVPRSFGYLPASLPYPIKKIFQRRYTLKPAEMYRVNLRLHSGNVTYISTNLSLPMVAGKRLTIDYSAATQMDEQTILRFGGILQTPPNLIKVLGVFKVDGRIVAQSDEAFGSGTECDLEMTFLQPYDEVNLWPSASTRLTAGVLSVLRFDTFLDGENMDGGAFGADPISALEAILDAEAKGYLSALSASRQKLAQLTGVRTAPAVGEIVAKPGVSVSYVGSTPSQLEVTRLSIDVARIPQLWFDNVSSSADNLIDGYQSSFLEHSVFEKILGMEAVSAVKVLQLSRDKGVDICHIQGSIASACPNLQQSDSIRQELASQANAATSVDVPETPIKVSDWTGTAYILQNLLTGSGAYVIAGGIGADDQLFGGSTIESLALPLNVLMPCGSASQITLDAVGPTNVFTYCNDTVQELNIKIPIRFVTWCGGEPVFAITNQFTVHIDLPPGTYDLRHIEGQPQTRKLVATIQMTNCPAVCPDFRLQAEGDLQRVVVKDTTDTFTVSVTAGHVIKWTVGSDEYFSGTAFTPPKTTSSKPGAFAKEGSYAVTCYAECDTGDWSEEASFRVIVPHLALAVDANRDGVIEFNKEESTPTTSGVSVDSTKDEDGKRFIFWINDDDDGNRYLPPPDDEGEHPESLRKDFENKAMRSRRGLEDFARLHIYIKGVISELSNGQILFGLKWKDGYSGLPAINIYRSVESDGGSEYLTDDTVASLQVSDSIMAKVIPDQSGQFRSVDTSSTFIFRPDFWKDLTEDKSKEYLLFEGAGEGKGELLIVIMKPDRTVIGSAPGVWLDLKDIRSMYQQFQATPTVIAAPFLTTAPFDAVPFDIQKAGFQPMPGRPQFIPAPDEDPKVFVMVNGSNEPYHHSTRVAETLFKRLYWQGYKGRFVSFRWETLVGPGDGLVPADYNLNEYLAWIWGKGLKDFMMSGPLPNGYSRTVGAHSLGCTVMASALRLGMSVDQIICMQGAIPAGCFDSSGGEADPGSINGYAKMWQAEIGDPSPDLFEDLGYRGFVPNNGAIFFNFFNEGDYALATGIFDAWEGNQVFKHALHGRPSQYFYNANILAPEERGSVQNLPDHTQLRFVSTWQESMAFLARSRSKALGASRGVGDAIIENIDIGENSPTKLGRERSDHSGEFSRRLQEVQPFYRKLGDLVK